MLLVLVALMMATILATSYLASRDNSAALGEHVADSASTRWAAVTGLDIGAALLQTQSTWRTDHTAGLIIDDMPVGSGTFDLSLEDFLTGAPPTATTESVLLTSTAAADGITQVATALAWVSAEEHGVVDVDLSEFAVFAVDELDLNDEALITRWYKAPSTKLGRRIAIGTSSMNPSAIAIAGDATILDSTVHHTTGASGSLVSSSNGTDVDQSALLDPIAVPQPPDTGVPGPGGAGLVVPLIRAGGTSTINSDARYSSILVTTNGTQTLQGNITVVSEGDCFLNTNSRLIINGNVKLVVFDDLTIDSSSLQLAPNATLTLFVGDTFSTDDGYLGEQRATVVRDNSGNATYMDPQRLQIFSIPGYAPGSAWLMEGNSTAKASIYAPPADFHIEDTSGLYGRITGAHVELRNEAALYYDHGMDRRIGYTNRKSSLFDANENIRAPFKALASLDRPAIQAAAAATQTNVLPPHKRETMVVGKPAVAPDVVLPSNPTPRPLDVPYEVLSLGLDARTFEDAL
jgi:hypothetical protein